MKRFISKAGMCLMIGLLGSAMIGIHSYAGDSLKQKGGGAAVTNQAEGIGYSVLLYDATNGLPTSDANVIMSTTDGFIWIGGYSGLICYDGTTFDRKDAATGVTNVNALFEDSRKRLWVGTNDNGVVSLFKNDNKHFTYKEGLPSSSIRAITEDKDGNIFIGTTQGICYVDTDYELHLLNDPQLNNAFINQLCADSNGTVYGCTKSGACFMIKDLRVNAYYNGKDLNIGEIRTVYPVPDDPGNVYIGTDEGILLKGDFNDDFRNAEKHSISKSINRIYYACNRVWVLSDDSIAYMDKRNDFHVLDKVPLTSAIDSMTEDYEGNLWFASSRQGVMKIVANKFNNITEHAGLEERVVNATCIYNGLLYMGTDTGLQIVDMHNNEKQNELTKYIGDARIRCITKDNDDNLWISTYTNDLGLVCMDKNGEISGYTEESGMPSNKIRCTDVASDGSLLVGSNGGLTIIKDGQIVRNIGEDSGLRNTVILTVVEGPDGKYYLGTDGDGLYVVDGNNVTRLGRDDGLTSDVILRVKYDSERDLNWLITSNSIEYIKDGSINVVEGFPYNNNYDIYFDTNDNAWVLASNGIYVVNVNEMITKPEFEYQFYDMSSGLPCIPTVNAFSAMSESGILYIPGRSGVCSVNINKYFEQTHEIRLLVPYIDVDGKSYFPENNVFNIPADSKVVTVYDYALTYSMNNPRIRYELSGFDDESTLVSKANLQPVRYTNLRGGKYYFKMFIVNASTQDVQQTASFKIVKDKAFYEEWWFYAFIVICVVFILAIGIDRYIKYKTIKFKKKEEENRLFIREMTEAFAKTIDMKDRYTNGHSRRVAQYTAMLTKELGYSDEIVEKYYNIALLHDIGKIGVPPEVLNKEGKLTDGEFAIIKSHSALGYNALKDISVMPELATGAGSHHERPDGKGYPKGLKGDEIPRVAQIIAVADTFDAMYSDRPYRKRMNFDKVVSIIREVSGTQLEGDVVEAFLRLVDKGEFKDPDDKGGGSMEDIDNIRKNYDKKEKSGNSSQSPKE